MDFTQELLMFQGAITSADSVHKFSRLTAKGGNEEKVDYVLQTLKRFLSMENYIDENGLVDEKVPLTRKFAMYIVLNADLDVLQEMMDVTGIEPVIWTIPTVPQYLMCEFMWQLHMQKFVYEIIPNCWPQLGLEVAEAFLENFKYFNPTECLDKLQKLSTACYALICRLTCFKFENDTLNNILEGAYNTFEKYLKYYIDPPKKYNLDVLNDDDMYKYKGERLKSMLLLVFDCCNLYDQDFNPNCDDTIYRLTHKDGYFQHVTSKMCESPNKLVAECLHNSNTCLLDVFKEIVMDVSVDIFCAWSEYEEDGKSFQQIVGELCDKVKSKLKSISSLKEHPVVLMIKVMARKPSEIKDIINSTDIETIQNKINANNEESSSWVRALVYKEGLTKDLTITKLVNSNLSQFDREECFALYNAYQDVSSSNYDFLELLINLKTNLFDKFNTEDKIKILKDRFKDKMFTDTVMFYRDLDCNLNEMFNKFVADADVEFSDVTTAFFQSPRSVYIKIFTVAIQNAQLIHPMVKLMMLFKDFMEHCYIEEIEPSVIIIMKSMANNCSNTDERNNLVKFIGELKEHNIVSITWLLMTVVMPSLHSGLVNENVCQIQVSLKILLETFRTDEIIEYRAPLLVMMGQIMDAVRCRSVDTFNSEALQALEMAIHYTKLIMATYLGSIPESEVHWLQYKIKELDLHPMNSYYFKILWNVYTRNYFEMVTNQRVYRKANLTMLAGHLLKVIPWATLDEWCEAWNSFLQGGLKEKHVLHLYHSVIDEFTKYVEANRSEKALACLFNSYKNLVHIIRYKFLREPLTNSQVKTCVHLLSLNLGRANPEDAAQFGALIGPLLAYLVGRQRDYTVNIGEFFVNNIYYDVVSKFLRSDE